jgi:hypothetical protein
MVMRRIIRGHPGLRPGPQSPRPPEPGSAGTDPDTPSTPDPLIDQVRELYNSVAEEPVPASLQSLLKRLKS